jgi:hypothetical protein
MSDQPRPDPVQRFFGAALMAVGALIAVLCGLCTVAYAGVALIAMAMNTSNLQLLLSGVFGGALLVAVVGGTPTVAGILLFRWGRRLWRPTPRIPSEQVELFSDEPDEDHHA